MRNLISIILALCITVTTAYSQDSESTPSYKKHGVVWSAGVFKAWLQDFDVGFNRIGDQITPVFTEENKSGFAIQSHYMYKPLKWFGVGVHAGVGLDVSSFIEAPVLLFGGSISVGNKHQVIIDFGLADGKRRIVPDNIRNDLMNANLTEIPEIFDHTQFNTDYYIGISYRIF